MIDTLIVGAGPAGLSAAIELRRLGVEHVVVCDREQEPGGIPRHTDHVGFGWRDQHRVMSGPRYAQRLVRAAESVGVELRLGRPVFELSGARSYLLATGTRERPRSARLVAGTRPAGVLTTGALQQLARAGTPVGERAVIVGAEHVSFSAALTLRHSGCLPMAIVTEHSAHQSARSLVRVARTPVITGRRVVEILGRGRVSGVLLDDGSTLPCDTVVFTGDWTPEIELARTIGLELDPGTRGPQVDGRLRTSAEGVFAAGNLLHGAEPAGVCALDGRHVAGMIHDFLGGTRDVPNRLRLPMHVAAPVVWISPNVWNASCPPPRSRFLLRVGTPVTRIEITQGERRVWTGKVRGNPSPNRSCWIPADWRGNVDADAGPLVISAIS